MGQVADLWASIGLEMQEAKWKKADNLIETVAARVKQLAINAALATTDVDKAMSVIGFKNVPKATNKYLGDAGEVSKTSAVMNKLGMAVKGAALAYVGLQGAQMAWGAVNDTLALGGKLTDLSQATGVSAEALQVWDFAARQAGGSLETVTGGVKKFNAGFLEAAKTGKGDAVDGLRALGLTVKQVKANINREGLEGTFEMIAGKLAKLPDGSKKAKIAMDLFGRSGGDLIPIVNGLEGAAATFRDMGLGISNEDVAALDDAGDQIDLVKDTFASLRNELVIALLPVIKDVTAGFIEWFKANKDLVRANIKNYAMAVVQVLRDIWPALRAIGNGVALVTKYFSVFKYILFPILVPLKMIWWVMEKVIDAVKLLGRFAVAAAGVIKDAFWSVVSFFKEVGSAISGAFHSALDWIIDKVQAVIDGVKWAVNEAKKIPGALGDAVGTSGLAGAVTGSGLTEAQNAIVREKGVYAYNDPKFIAAGQAPGGSTSVTVGQINVTSNNADPKKVADEAVNALQAEYRKGSN